MDADTTPPILRVTYASAGDNSEIYQADRDINITHNHKSNVPRVNVKRAVLKPAVVAYAQAEGYQEANDILWHADTGGLVVLVGEPRIGRRTAALSMLCAGTERPVFLLNVTWGEHSFDDLPREPNSRYLLDLTFAGELPDEFAEGLQDYGNALWRIESKIVVTTTETVWAPFFDEAQAYTVLIHPPQVTQVIEARFAYLTQSDAAASRVLHEAPLKRLLNEIGQSGARPDVGVDFALELSKRCATSDDIAEFVVSWRSWDKFIVDHLVDEDMHSIDKRILIIAIAVLHGGTSESILEACSTLAGRLGTASDPANILQRADLRTRLKTLDAFREGDRIFLARTNLKAHDDVLDYFWENRPDLRKPIFSWITELAARKPMDSVESKRLIQVADRLASRHRWVEALDLLFGMIGGTKVQSRLAYTSLELLLRSPDMASALQRKLYEWAGGSKNLIEVARLCGGDMGPNSLAVALVRLKRLASHAEGQSLIDEVQRSLRNVAGRNPKRISTLLAGLDDWSDHGKAVGIVGLLSPDWLSASELLTDVSPTREDPVFQRIVHSWKHALGYKGLRNEALVLLAQWSIWAERDPGMREFIVATISELVNDEAWIAPREIFVALSDDIGRELFMFLKRAGLSSIDSEQVFNSPIPSWFDPPASGVT